jgi:hypothetical protein
MAPSNEAVLQAAYEALARRDLERLIALLFGPPVPVARPHCTQDTGGSNNRHVWEGACGWCGRWVTVSAGDEEAPSVQRDLEMFGRLECRECADDRRQEFDHIARSASDAEHARIVVDVPLAGIFRGAEHERAYLAWCERRGLAPISPRSRVAAPSSGDPAGVAAEIVSSLPA